MQKIEYLLKWLVVLLLILVVVLSVVAFFKDKNTTAEEISVQEPFEKEAHLFGDLGVLRAKTNDESPVSIVLQPYFEYPLNDSAFEEELVKKKGDLRIEILAWFSVRSITEIKSMGEIEVKKGLLTAVNKLLIMGKLEKIYFEDYVILE